MEFFSYVVTAIWQAFIPVGIISFGMVWWALSGGMVKDRANDKVLLADLEKLGKEKDRQKSNPMHEKWFKLGGGFYGIVGLYTYAVVEVGEIFDLLKGLKDLVFKLDISILINFFIESITNFITAVTWPLFWNSDLGWAGMGVWIAAAYGGYRLGAAMARQHAGMPSGGLADGENPD